MSTRCNFNVMSQVIHDEVIDSARWMEFPYRCGDIVIATFWKTGTTWLQQIVGQLIFEGLAEVSVGALSPWIEHRGVPMCKLVETLEHQSHRRFVKTHLPRHYLPYNGKASYIYVARDARDQIWSAHHHLSNLKTSSMLTRTREYATLASLNFDVKAYYLEILGRGGSDAWGYWSHLSSWWSGRHLPNVLLVHYSNLQADLPKEIMRIADFLEIQVAPHTLEDIVEHCSFEFMRLNSTKVVGIASQALQGGAPVFMNQGRDGRWKSVLTPEEASRCDMAAEAHLPDDCAHWLRTGQGLR